MTHKMADAAVPQVGTTGKTASPVFKDLSYFIAAFKLSDFLSPSHYQ